MKRYLYVAGYLLVMNCCSLYADDPINTVIIQTMLDSTSFNITKTIHYYDAIGRPLQTVQSGIAPNEVYLYTKRLYDVCGRDSILSLPWTDNEENVFYSGIPNHRLRQNYSTDNCYSTSSYDALGRITFVSTPGTQWEGKGKTIRYITNDENSVKYYVSSSSQQGCYPAGSLTGEVTTDEDGISIATFKDLAGRVILERRGSDDTYFIYSNKDRLTGVLSPMAQTSSTSLNSFRYSYDSNGRLYTKRLPGCNSTTYKYDNSGRLLSLREPAHSDQAYTRYFYYDGLGRVVVQGYSDLTIANKTDPFITSREPSSGKMEIPHTGYYAKYGMVLPELKMEMVRYYDDYSFLDLPLFTDSIGSPELRAENHTCATSLLTGEVIATSNGRLLAKVYYYDDNGRVIDTRETLLNGDFIRTTTEYSFTDKPVCIQKDIHEGNKTFTFKELFTYDNKTDNIISHDIVHNGITTNVNSYSYNTLGQVSKQKQNNDKLLTSFQYDEHSWIKKIQTLRMQSVPQLFSQQLFYGGSDIDNACYNGNISRMKWNMMLNTFRHGYKFYYDDRDRLTEAKMVGYDFEEDSLQYSERIGYDKNSNITQMVRTGVLNDSTITLDSLVYSHSGNRITRIRDYGQSVAYSDIFELKSNPSRYSYYYNISGDMVYDSNKGIAKINYDYLGHPIRVQFTNGNLIEYVYAADGKKLRVKHTTAVEGLNVTLKNTLDLTPETIMHVDSVDYCDNIRMANVFVLLRKRRVPTLQLDYGFNGGHLSLRPVLYRPANSSSTGIIHQPSYHYHIRDYQGNVRLVVNDSCEVESYNSYYSYGGPFEGENATSVFPPHMYNGKEYDHVHGLDWYDYGARHYDPAMARFTQMDPLSEQYPHLSPYAYCAGNPVKYIDPDGRNPIFNRKGELLGVDDWGMRGVALFFDMEKEDFELKYSHEEALKLDLGAGCLIDEAAKEQYLKTYNDLPNRPDWDGYITLSEANHWYRHGNGETLYADLSKIDLSGICSLGESFVGQEKGFNLLMGASLSINDGLVYGNISLKRYPNHTVRAFVDRYNFEMHSWRNPINWIRNFQTIIGELVAGDGTPYNIYPYGSKKLRPILPWLK